MKASILIKFLVILPIILLADYVLMVLIGCATCLFGFGNDFYCGSYCLIGKSILLLSAVLIGYLMYPDMKKIFKRNSSATTI
jgi:energy-coupling factor transporter transmembrane protein EcfT